MSEKSTSTDAAKDINWGQIGTYAAVGLACGAIALFVVAPMLQKQKEKKAAGGTTTT